jgi:antitoxin (DNA-binding transcriptional repressor) of toxin-antitoxin stability system
MITVTIANFKSHLSELMGRVSFKKETLLVTRHGRALVRISPPEEPPKHLSRVRGWLNDSDPFFKYLSDIVRARNKHIPRTLK